MSEYLVGIIGNGFVGRATAEFKCKDINVLIYDIDKSKSDVPSISELNKCQAIFVCLPTPMNKDGSANTSLVENAVKELKEKCPDSERIIRSTVPIGFSKSMDSCFMPEFLTEKNWKNDFFNCQDWLFGVDRETKFDFEDFFLTAWKNKKISNCLIKRTKTSEAEIVKYIKNTFLALKVSYFNEIKDICDKANIDYDLVSRLAALDPRIGLSHIKVPGPDGRRGFGGTCFPKDLESLIHQSCRVFSIDPIILKAVLYRNIFKDRPEKDWENDKGRAVV